MTRSRRALVTGADGFVGEHLTRQLLQSGYVVIGTTYGTVPGGGEIDWIPLDLLSRSSVDEAVRRARPDFVVHLAAQSSVGGSFGEPVQTWETNATGTFLLLEALGAHGPEECRALVVSSAEVYGPVPEVEQPIGEERRLRPHSPYAASKAAAEMAALEAGARGSVQVVVARSFNHTGPGQDTRFALPSFAAQLAQIQRGESEPRLHVGNLEVRRDILDVRDVARAYLHLLEAGSPGETYNVCSGTAVHLRSLVDQLVTLSGTDTEVVVDPERYRPVDLSLLVGNNEKLRQLGWEPRIGIEETLRDLFRSVGGTPASM